MSSPNNRWPRVVGFDVPKLVAKVDYEANEPVIAMLDVEPSIAWMEEFRRQVACSSGAFGTSSVIIETSMIRFFGSIGDARSMADSIRFLMESVSARLQKMALQALTTVDQAAF